MSSPDDLQSFTNVLKEIVRAHPEGVSPQEIREEIKSRFPTFYATPSHHANVEKGHYKDLDHALLAQIYLTAHQNRSFAKDKTKKPYKLTQVTQFTPFISEEKPRPKLMATAAVPLPGPCAERVSHYLNKWSGLENYVCQEDALNDLFQKFCPENKLLKEVLLKVSALNDFYSTHIFDPFSVAQHIVSLDVDIHLKTSDYSLVTKIANAPIRGKIKNLYSFATKYCSHHYPTAFPIFDSFVEKMLCRYRDVDSFFNFE